MLFQDAKVAVVGFEVDELEVGYRSDLLHCVQANGFDEGIDLSFTTVEPQCFTLMALEQLFGGYDVVIMPLDFLKLDVIRMALTDKQKLFALDTHQNCWRLMQPYKRATDDGLELPGEKPTNPARRLGYGHATFF